MRDKSEESSEMNKLLILKKEQEKLRNLNEESEIEKMRLEVKYSQFASMNSAQMEEQLRKLQEEAELSSKPEKDTTQVGVQSDEIDLIIQDYKDRYSKEEWYKEPQRASDGTTTLTFPSEDEAGKFLMDQAAKNRTFILTDANTNKVLAYSNGDGTLYNSDGSAYEGGAFKNSNIDAKDFNMPERSNSLGM